MLREDNMLAKNPSQTPPDLLYREGQLPLEHRLSFIQIRGNFLPVISFFLWSFKSP